MNLECNIMGELEDIIDIIKPIPTTLGYNSPVITVINPNFIKNLKIPVNSKRHTEDKQIFHELQESGKCVKTPLATTFYTIYGKIENWETKVYEYILLIIISILASYIILSGR